MQLIPAGGDQLAGIEVRTAADRCCQRRPLSAMVPPPSSQSPSAPCSSGTDRALLFSERSRSEQFSRPASGRGDHRAGLASVDG